MLLLVALAVLVIVGVVVVVVTGALRSPSGGPASDTRGAFGVGIATIVGVGALVVLVVGGIVISFGVRGGGDDEGDGRPGSDHVRRSVVRSAAPAREPTPLELAAGVREVVVVAPSDDEISAPQTLDEIGGRVVLRVHAIGFEPGARGDVEQCIATGTGVERCGNHFPVLFDESGAARFQYLIGDTYLDPGASEPTCPAGTTRCVVRLTDDSATAVVQTVFGGPAPRTRMTITPRPDGVASGEWVDVSLSGFQEGDEARVTVCAAPATSGTRRCGAPGPVAAVAIDADGAGTTRLVLREEKVGSERVACGRETPCAIVVTTDSGTSTISPVEITFASGPGASYDTARLALGLVLAAILLGLAAVLVRRTDWRKPSEAETPLMDAAALAEV